MDKHRDITELNIPMSEQITTPPKQAESQVTAARPQRRFASIDFLRGTAISIMIFLHSVAWFLDVNALINNLNDEPLINLLALAILPYLGGLAGFFLLVSAIGNMISMYKHLQAGKSVEDMVIKQVVGGIFLIIFAYLVESTIGYLGAAGDFFRSLHNPTGPNYLFTIFERGFHFETIHTIAWCVLINGIVQGILSRNGAWRSIKKQIIAYAVMAVIIVALTQPIWMLVEMYGGAVPFPQEGYGYPWIMSGTEKGHEYFRFYLLDPNTTFVDVLKGVFLNPLAAPMEPLFPYLAVSFIGSIIGIVLCQPRESIPRNFNRIMMWIAMIMFIVGTVGIVAFVISVMDASGFEKAAEVYQWISYHRHWFDNPNEPLTSTFPLAWLWQFLSLNGFGILATMFVIRMVEFRGWGAGFAKKTTFVRRFGFTAFTNYNNQWYLWIVWYFFGMIVIAGGFQVGAWPSFDPANPLVNASTGGSFNPFNPYNTVNWASTLLIIVIVFAMYHGIMLLWEKVGYIGSLEWCIGTIAYTLIPAKKARKEGTARQRWWQKGKLDVKGAFYNADWQNIVEKEQVDHKGLVDSKLAFKLALAALVSIIFMPTAFVTLRLAIDAQKTEGKNMHNTVAKVVSIVGMCLVLGVVSMLFFLTPNMLGFAL